MSPWSRILIGLGMIIVPMIFVERFCDNSLLPMWAQFAVAIPCFPLFWFLLPIFGFAVIVEALFGDSK